MKKHAVALRAFTHADDSYAEGAVILDLDAGYLGEWGPVGLVREATDEEVTAAREAAQATKKGARQR